MTVFFGDTAGSLTGKQTGLDQTGLGETNVNILFGDAGAAITDSARGGDDILIGGALHDTGENHLFGDSDTLSGKAQGGNDTLAGGDHNEGPANVLNIYYGDALNMFGFARGGDDSITGGSNNGD